MYQNIKKAHLRSDFRKKILEWGSNPQKYYISVEKYFVRFWVQMKTAKSPFEIISPLALIHLLFEKSPHKISQWNVVVPFNIK